MSSLPSPLKSPTATEEGEFPVAGFDRIENARLSDLFSSVAVPTGLLFSLLSRKETLPEGALKDATPETAAVTE